ncbi:sugar kinase|uniref:sugar kinase n=1 Tax=Pseudomonas sp. SbOxS1 TaxID=2723884 RepID=UPI0015D116DA|nr:sugar kinase [Pseudomonas sp. SbOxS1]NYU05158.1 sugar kinase [Pseudomonas sp. SbOxS1]
MTRTVGDELYPALSRPRRIALVGECMIEMGGRETITQTFGGDTLNTAVYLARTCPRDRVTVDYMTAIGADAFSGAMRQSWRDEQLGDRHVQVIADALPGLYFIQTDDRGERRFLYWRGQSAARRMFDGPQAEPLLSALDSFDSVYVSGVTLAILSNNGRQRLLQRLEQARANGLRVVFDNNYRPLLWAHPDMARSAHLAMLKLTDLAIVTWEDDVQLFGYADTEALFAAYADIGVHEVVIKRGARSCLIQCAAGRLEVPAQQVTTVVDTTAAGDAFSAGYLACRLQGGAPDQSAAWGHLLAATVIQHPGALIPLASMPDTLRV